MPIITCPHCQGTRFYHCPYNVWVCLSCERPYPYTRPVPSVPSPESPKGPEPVEGWPPVSGPWTPPPPAELTYEPLPATSHCPLATNH